MGSEALSELLAGGVVVIDRGRGGAERMKRGTTLLGDLSGRAVAGRAVAGRLKGARFRRAETGGEGRWGGSIRGATGRGLEQLEALGSKLAQEMAAWLEEE